MLKFADECGGICEDVFLQVYNNATIILTPDEVLEFPNEKCRIFKGNILGQEVIAGVLIDNDTNTNTKNLISVGDEEIKNVELTFENFNNVSDIRVVVGHDENYGESILGILFDLGNGKYTACIEYGQITVSGYENIPDCDIIKRMDALLII
jgi:hypothetical protein